MSAPEGNDLGEDIAVLNLKALGNRIRRAHAAIQPYVRRTPVEFSQCLSSSEGSVYLKLESEQCTGSFKVRGAVNKVFCELTRASNVDNSTPNPLRLTTASTGNHALATAYAIQTVPGGQYTIAEVYLPNNVSEAKLKLLRSSGLHLREVDSDDCAVSEVKAREAAEGSENSIFVSPYNDLDVICGQGTIALEIMEQLNENVDYIFVPVGGGGMISGIAAYVNAYYPQCKVIGCQPRTNACMVESLQKGKILGDDEFVNQPTLSDGTSGGIEEKSLTFPMCRNLVHDWILVSEEEIEKSLILVMQHHHKIIEGSAAVAVAAYNQQKEKYRGKTAAIVCCGANINLERLNGILQKHSD